MRSKKTFYLARHLTASGVLAVLDLHQRLRSRVSRNFLRVAMFGLSGILIATVFSSVIALVRITQSVQSLIGDSMVGLESAVGMRATVRESQLELLRLRLNPDRKLTSQEIDTFQDKMRALIGKYPRGIIEGMELSYSSAIENGLERYLAALDSLRNNSQPSLEAVLAADQEAKNLVDVVERAYQFNRERIHARADEAGGAARQALSNANLLGWGCALIIVCLALVYFVYRWLALPEESDA
jgi:hypothetical protein